MFWCELQPPLALSGPCPAGTTLLCCGLVDDIPVFLECSFKVLSISVHVILIPLIVSYTENIV